MLALYFGGMGARSMNFHREVPVRMGYEAEAQKIQDLYMDGKKDEAAAARSGKGIMAEACACGMVRPTPQA